MEGRRLRRFDRPSPHSSFLPVSASASTATAAPVTTANATVTCCYCDFKIRFLNQPLFRFGRTHAAFFRFWFSIGVGFALSLVFAVIFILVWVMFYGRDSNNTAFFFLFGFSPSVSVGDAAYVIISSLIAVSVHEFGHAVAAASEGIQVEYIAIFIAILFPGALVALNYDLLQALPRFTVLRVYCAGIWHNAACCAVCGLALFLMPVILFPFYTYGDSPMVLDVPSTSPLSGYLSPGDVIVSLDGTHIHNEHDWMEMASLLDRQTLQNSNLSGFTGLRAVNGRKGYCVPNSMIEESKKIQLVDSQSGCPGEFTAFVTVECSDTSTSSDVTSEDGQSNKRESRHCLNAKDIVKLNKCGDGWMTTVTNQSSCICSKLGRDSISDSGTADFVKHGCGGTFVFVGDLITMAHSIQLTTYRPRWTFAFVAYLPNMLEKVLMCVFHISLTLALLNSLPVYFLDGESILEVTLCFITSLSPRKREKVLQVSLLGGTLISILAFLRMFFLILW
ncbi:membrane-bound transcription factor site-2 protease homolog isoform X2 [Pistacia vera]|uniref:membrane-bound transcription factor site-2 protease homolog isoform X2 n=1 Tax=Pistacia vera TaxID=55513 RepID=UPI001263295F|nr:membrane-bound transcription factor site-2 protease homolog isoform X2 [Pistacia vera]